MAARILLVFVGFTSKKLEWSDTFIEFFIFINNYPKVHWQVHRNAFIYTNLLALADNINNKYHTERSRDRTKFWPIFKPIEPVQSELVPISQYWD